MSGEYRSVPLGEVRADLASVRVFTAKSGVDYRTQGRPVSEGGHEFGDDAIGTVYYQPEEVLIDPAEQPRCAALRIRSQILGVERGIPLVRVRLNTAPPLTEDLTAYLKIADEVGADRVLDIGCGTGCLAVLLAESGRTVVGVDPAEASLEVAKSKDRTGRITWVHGDATTLPAFAADLAVMTGNVAQVFLTDNDWTQTLRGIRAALRLGGCLVFEVRRPERRAWEEWAADTAPVTLDVPGVASVERCLEVTDVSLPFVSFRFTYTFLADGAVVTADSTLRFRSRDEVETSLVANGYRVVDVREAPDRPGREFVFIAESPVQDTRRL